MTEQMKDNRILAAAMITALMTTFMGSALNLSVPSLERAFSVNAATVSWIVSAYTITVAAMSLLDAVKKLPKPQRPRVWILLVDQDGASAAEFDICQPFKTKDEQISRNILARATAEDPDHIHHRHVGRWPDILFNATMISRRLPAKVLQDKLIGFGTRTKLRIEMLAIDRLFTEILFSKKDDVSKEDASNVSI